MEGETFDNLVKRLTAGRAARGAGECRGGADGSDPRRGDGGQAAGQGQGQGQGQGKKGEGEAQRPGPGAAQGHALPQRADARGRAGGAAGAPQARRHPGPVWRSHPRPERLRRDRRWPGPEWAVQLVLPGKLLPTPGQPVQPGGRVVLCPELCESGVRAGWLWPRRDVWVWRGRDVYAGGGLSSRPGVHLSLGAGLQPGERAVPGSSPVLPADLPQWLL
jgi:hypothetical protein